MHFNSNLLLEYRQLLQTTDLRDCYREFIRLFRYIRTELEKRMKEYRFQGNITENGMDYSYFSFTGDKLKAKGLKITIVFIHRDFQFEVWVSGSNRKYQSEYYNLLKERDIPFELTDDPLRKDYILRVAADCTADISDGDLVVEELRDISDKLLMFAESL